MVLLSSSTTLTHSIDYIPRDQITIFWEIKWDVLSFRQQGWELMTQKKITFVHRAMNITICVLVEEV